MKRVRAIFDGGLSYVRLTVGVWLVWTAAVWGQCETDKLVADDGSAGDWLGWSVAASGDVVLIGAPKVDHTGFDMGAAYVFRPDGVGWSAAPRLLAGDATVGDHGDHLGWSVAIDGDVAVIGAPYDYLGPFLEGVQIGSVYVFRFDGSAWIQEQKLVPADGEEEDRFGWSVAVSGETIAVGSRGDDDNGAGAGSAYVYEFDGVEWVERAKLFGSTGGAGLLSAFGIAVALDGDRLLVGAPWDDATGIDHGAAYTFVRENSTWRLEQLVVPIPSDRGSGNWFGQSVGLSGDVMVIGAPSVTVQFQQDAGAAFVFRRNGANWFQEVKLVSTDPEQGGHFGRAVDVDGDTALVGAYSENDNVGSAHVFAFDGVGWAATAELIQSDAEEIDPLGTPPFFGDAVALVGSTATVAAPFRDTPNGGDTGAIYIIELDGLVGDWDADCDVDLSDFLGFNLCSAGPDQPPADSCPANVDADLDGDGDVDRADFASFQVRFTGE